MILFSIPICHIFLWKIELDYLRLDGKSKKILKTLLFRKGLLTLQRKVVLEQQDCFLIHENKTSRSKDKKT